jgi:hypothetical protein
VNFKIGDIVRHIDWEELGIIVERQLIQHSNETYIIVYWTTGKRGYWRSDTASRYLTVVG